MPSHAFDSKLLLHVWSLVLIQISYKLKNLVLLQQKKTELDLVNIMMTSNTKLN